MNVKRIAATILIFVLASAGWIVLGTVTARRSSDSSSRLSAQVEGLWGTPLLQPAPSFSVGVPGTDRVRWLIPAENKIEVALDAEHRKKGLLWYPTYVARFAGNYTLSNEEAVVQKVRIHFEFPAKDGTYDEFSVVVDGKPLLSPVNTAEGVNELIEVAPGASLQFQVSYKTRGMGEWRYVPDQHTGRVRNMHLAANTNFARVDYPEGCQSPTSAAGSDTGMQLVWQASDLITRESIGVVIPEKLNPGPLTSRITFFAPVCLLFFFVLVATINILYKVDIHPMHYLFVAAGFFAFHLLLAYMAGLVNIHLSFLISTLVSVGLVTSYLSAALRGQFPWKVAIAGQLFFLILFSYTFFLEGITGLTVAIGSVVTLAILMYVTARLDWNQVFRQAKPSPPPLPSRAGQSEITLS